MPNTVRNVNKKWGVSNGLVLSNQDVYAVAGIRYENLYTKERNNNNSKTPLLGSNQNVANVNGAAL